MTSRTARLGLAGVSLFLLLFPLALGKPGLPTHLKADEAAYYAMAMSLAHDHDLVLDQRDVDRVFDEFPYGPVNNLILMSADGWRHAWFGKPWVYSLLAAPFVRLLGADGMLLCNMLLLVAMLWMGMLYLRRFNDEGLAALYSAGFFLLSVGFAYVFWLQPETFNMAAVTACLFFGLPREGANEELPRPRRDLAFAVLSGAALALAVYNKPMLAVLGVAPLLAHVRGRRWRASGAWLGGAAGCLALLALLSVALTRTPTSYLGVQRGGFTLCGPGQMPVLPTAAGLAAPATPRPQPSIVPAPAPAPARTSAPAAAAGGRPAGPTPPAAPAATTAGPAGAAQAVQESPTGNSYRWLFRLPDTSPSELRDNLLYFLLGRHTGLLLYLPFAGLSVLLFLLHGPRTLERWTLLATTVVVALFFLLLIAWNWQGGGGFVGNRYFVNVYPAFLFLVTRARPRALVTAGYAWAGLFLAPLLLAPMGSPVVEPTLQSHVRGRPYRWFPLELTLRNVPGYQRISLGDFRVVGRRDVVLPDGDALLLQGASPVELHLVADAPLPRLAFRLSSPAADNDVSVEMGAFHQTFHLGAGQSAVVEIPPQPPLRRWTIKTGTLRAWRMVVTSRHGRPQVWTREFPPNACPGWPYDAKQHDSFYTGVELVYLGDPGRLQADVYHAEWRHVDLPAAVHAGDTLRVPVTLANRSGVAWPNRAGARVRLAYHWLDALGRVVVQDGERTELPQPVPPGGTLSIAQTVVAPPQPGRYTLVLDPLLETVAWFGDRDPQSEWRSGVDVLPAGGGAAGAPAATPAPAASPAPAAPVR